VEKHLVQPAPGPATDDVVAAPNAPAHAGRRVVLAYHAIGSWRSEMVVSEPTLRVQAERFARAGYVALTASDSERRLREGTLPRRTVVFTFDDGFRSVLAAKRVLAEFGFPATAFLVTGFASSSRPLDWWGLRETLNAPPEALLQPLSWDDARELRDAGWEIGSHTVTHRLLTNLTPADLTWELATSREAIRAHLGDCECVAYPYGVANAAVAEAAREAGYDSGWTLTSAHLADEPLLRPRTGVVEQDTGLRLAAKTSTAGGWLRRGPLARIRAERRSRHWIPPA
jgi:peptidoglycan/xylan/chitin deacetylase (PgdA/CDA1 family)